MHPDNLQLAAYLDGAMSEGVRAELRGHILTCATCAARLERLRDDSRRITMAMSSGGMAPDVRSAVRARLRRPSRYAWLGRGMALASTLAALLLFAVLIGLRGGGTASRTPDRLFVTDKANTQIVALDAASGGRMNLVKLAEPPSSITYDQSRQLLYALLPKSVIAVDPHTLQPVGRWEAPQPFDLNAGMALDSRHGRLYVPQPGGVVALTLDTAEIAVAQTYDIGGAANALALSPDGSTLFALDGPQATIWTIDASSGASRSQMLIGVANSFRKGWVVADPNGEYIYVLLTRAGQNDLPALWRIDRGGQADAPTVLAGQPPPYDMDLLDTRQLAIPRGDGLVGGVELISTDTMSTVARLEPNYDQHHAVAGPRGVLFGLNFSHFTITRFDTIAQTKLWRTSRDQDLVPWEGVYVPGGWRWPWQP